MNKSNLAKKINPDFQNNVIYIGPERRLENRRSKSPYCNKLERYIINFGLNRRNKIERRSNSNSWLLVSQRCQK